MQQHPATFIAETEAAAGADLPAFVKDEFDAFLECDILAHGFLRLRCADCGHGKRLAFSCRRRGLCPSCGARRMVQTAAHLVEHVIPHVLVRQWVPSLPIPAAPGLHAAVRCGAHQRQALEQLCRNVDRPARSDERVQCNAVGQR